MFKNTFDICSHIQKNTQNPNPMFKITIYYTKQTNNAKMHSNFWIFQKTDQKIGNPIFFFNSAFKMISVVWRFVWPALGGPKILVYIYLYKCISKQIPLRAYLAQPMTCAMLVEAIRHQATHPRDALICEIPYMEHVVHLRPLTYVRFGFLRPSFAPICGVSFCRTQESPPDLPFLNFWKFGKVSKN